MTAILKSKAKVFLAALVGTLFALSGRTQTTFTYAFDAGSPDFQSKFSVNGSAGTSSYTYSATGGISGSGQVVSNSNSTASAVLNTPYSSSGAITLSAMFKTASSLTFGDVIGLGIYLTPTTTTSTASSYVALLDGSATGLTANSWFKISVTLTPNGSTYLQSVQLEPFDSAGVSTGSAFSPSSGAGGAYSASPAALIAASTVYVGIYGGGALEGARAIDNFSVTGTAIPEPSTYAVLMGATLLVGVVVRRRSRGRSVPGPMGE